MSTEAVVSYMHIHLYHFNASPKFDFKTTVSIMIVHFWFVIFYNTELIAYIWTPCIRYSYVLHCLRFVSILVYMPGFCQIWIPRNIKKTSINHSEMYIVRAFFVIWIFITLYNLHFKYIAVNLLTQTDQVYYLNHNWYYAFLYACFLQAWSNQDLKILWSHIQKIQVTNMYYVYL